MKKKRKNESWIVYEICSTFGSEFQKKTAEAALDTIIRSWVQFYSAMNKKTSIVVEVKRQDMNPVVVWKPVPPLSE